MNPRLLPSGSHPRFGDHWSRSGTLGHHGEKALASRYGVSLEGPSIPAASAATNTPGENSKATRRAARVCRGPRDHCVQARGHGQYEWIETRGRIKPTVQRIQMLREGRGDGINTGIDFPAETSPTVASIICAGSSHSTSNSPRSRVPRKTTRHGAHCAENDNAGRHG